MKPFILGVCGGTASGKVYEYYIFDNKHTVKSCFFRHFGSVFPSISIIFVLYISHKFARNYRKSLFLL